MRLGALPEPMFVDPQLTTWTCRSRSAVRRHAATFRSVRMRLLGEAEDARALAAGGGAVDPEEATERVWPHAVTGDGLRDVGARTAAKVWDAARAAQWRVQASYARGRRQGSGPWVETAVVRVARAVGDRPDPQAATSSATPSLSGRGVWHAHPETGKWSFREAVVWDPAEGTRRIGARELVKISSPIADADASTPSGASQAPPLSGVDTLECNHDIVRGEGGPDGEDRS
jgi:hypothetical protein